MKRYMFGLLFALLLVLVPVRTVSADVALPADGSVTTVTDGDSGQAVQAPSGSSRMMTKMRSGWTWYIARASGLVAAVLLTLLILMGIGLVTGHTYRFLEPITAWRVHRAMGIALGASILVHILVLMLDKYQPFNLLQVLIPFLAPYQPKVFIAFGVLAMYTAGVSIITSLVWLEKKPQLWRKLHYVGYGLVVLLFFHGLFTGTDTKHGIVRILWLLGGVAIVAGCVRRLLSARTIDGDDR